MAIIGHFLRCMIVFPFSRIARGRMDMVRTEKRNPMDPYHTICYRVAILFCGISTSSSMKMISTTLATSWRSVASYVLFVSSRLESDEVLLLCASAVLFAGRQTRSIRDESSIFWSSRQRVFEIVVYGPFLHIA